MDEVAGADRGAARRFLEYDARAAVPRHDRDVHRARDRGSGRAGDGDRERTERAGTLDRAECRAAAASRFSQAAMVEAYLGRYAALARRVAA